MFEQRKHRQHATHEAWAVAARQVLVGSSSWAATTSRKAVAMVRPAVGRAAIRMARWGMEKHASRGKYTQGLGDTLIRQQLGPAAQLGLLEASGWLSYSCPWSEGHALSLALNSIP